MRRADDAKRRRADLKAPIPTPTAEAIAESKAEEDGREETGRLRAIRMNFSRHPDMNKAAKAGEPSMEDEKQTSAAALIQQLNREVSGGGSAEASAEPLKAGQGQAPGANQPPPTTQDGTPAKPPDRVNDMQNPAGAQAGADQQNSSDQQDSSSKKKGKKGLRRLIPF